MKAVQKHRGITTTAKAVKKVTGPELPAAAAEVEKLLDEAQAKIELLGVEKLLADLKMIRSEWAGLRTKVAQLSAKESLEHHSIIVSYILDLLDEISNLSGLALDPSAESYRLIETGMNLLPRMTEDSALARGAGMIDRRG